MSKEILCIADDTTGALDVGGSFKSRGYETEVILDYNDSQNDLSEGKCCVINANSRYLLSQESASIVLDTLESFSSKNNLLFLKVDSTLRGNIFHDVDTIAEQYPKLPIMICPAFPYYHRVCHNGIYYVNGKPIKESAFSQDASFFFNSSYLHQNRKDIFHVHEQIIQRGVAEIILAMRQSGKRKFTFDTLTDSDLKVIGEAALQLESVLVGSSGLARSLPLFNNGENSTYNVDGNLPILFINGSYNSTSTSQVKTLKDSGITIIPIDVHSQKVYESKEKIQDSLNNSISVGITIPDNYIGDGQFKKELEQAIAELTQTSQPHHLIVVGGETARCIFSSRRIKRLKVQGEFQPGIPISVDVDSSSGNIFTKAGGFGNKDTLVNIYQYVQGNERNH